MISFESDYIAGAHPKILERLAVTNLEVLGGYGTDKYTLSASAKICEECGGNVDVHFLTGGTQTNAVVISALLREYEGVVAAESGHISLHEAGAVENTGHKVLTVKGELGKIMPCVLKDYLECFYSDENREHMVFPGMVYISHPTEYGTLYSKIELTELSQLCREYNIPLYMDGARLGYGLMSLDTDVTLKDIVRLCDVFYIGGTKMGALCGEAVVFTKDNTPAHFMNFIKKKGALMAKGRLLGVQFDTLFTGGLYYDIGRHAIDMAEKLKKVLRDKEYRFFIDSPTNQQFVILENSEMERLSEKVAFSFWEKYDENHTVVRFATSWSTTEEDLKILSDIL